MEWGDDVKQDLKVTKICNWKKQAKSIQLMETDYPTG